MIYRFIYPLSDYVSFFNLFGYITFRAAAAALTSFILSYILFHCCVPLFKKIGWTDKPKSYSPDEHISKEGTPVMGGLLMLGGILVSMLLWTDIFNPYIQLMFFTFVAMGLVGFYDDITKIKNNDGISTIKKLILQVIVAGIIAFVIYVKPPNPQMATTTVVPFFKNVILDWGMFYILLIIIAVVGTTNGVNFADGLDGLAIGLIMISYVTYGIFAYVTGHYGLSSYLRFPHLIGSGELTIVSMAVAGSAMAFLWYNAYPAEIFMGDVGSLSLGSGLAVMAFIIKQELLLILVGGIFLVEVLSSMIQIVAIRKFNKKVFAMAPIHHHFINKYKVPENKVVVRMWIVGIILSLLALSTLKIR